MLVCVCCEIHRNISRNECLESTDSDVLYMVNARRNIKKQQRHAN